MDPLPIGCHWQVQITGLVDLIWHSTFYPVCRISGKEGWNRSWETLERRAVSNSCFFDGCVMLFYPVTPSSGFYHAWHWLTGSCFYFSIIVSLGNSTVHWNQLLVGKDGNRRGLHDAHVSFYSFLMIFSLAACEEHLLFVVTQPGLFIDLGCLCSLQSCWWLKCFAILIAKACPLKQN